MLEAAFREKPAIHRFPGTMATRVQDLSAFVATATTAGPSALWTEAGDADDLRGRIEELPGFGEMKIKALGSVLAKRFGVEAAQGLVPNHPTLGDVDSAEALERYQAAKRAYKASLARRETACRRVRHARAGRRDELLVFDHRDHPCAGTQAPAGRIDPGESLEQCLHRELDEEAGLRGTIVRELGRAVAGEVRQPRVRDARRGEAPGHVGTRRPRKGDDAGLVFSTVGSPCAPT